MWKYFGYLDYRNWRMECCVYQLSLQFAFSLKVWRLLESDWTEISQVKYSDSKIPSFQVEKPKLGVILTFSHL